VKKSGIAAFWAGFRFEKAAFCEKIEDYGFLDGVLGLKSRFL